LVNVGSITKFTGGRDFTNHYT